MDTDWRLESVAPISTRTRCIIPPHAYLWLNASIPSEPLAMKYVHLYLIAVLSAGMTPATAYAQLPEQQPRGFLAGRYDLQALGGIIVPQQEWHPYPTANEPQGWQAVPEAVRRAHIALGEAALGAAWKPLPATVFLEYVRTGNRSNFEQLSFDRRRQLAHLVLAEAMEGKGRFVDDIVNGIWAICEETYWGVPAHVGLQRAGSGLPDVSEPTVDLFAAETGSLLAWTLYLVGDRLDEVSPLIRERIQTEVDRRILTPNLERDDFWWMGFGSGQINNWNPWINSNWLTTVLLLEHDDERRLEGIHKIMRSLDRFIDSYPEDGGCDEGPGYWSRAAGSLFDALDLLESASNGVIDIFDEPLIRKMGQYIYRSYISGRYFINFADAAARITVEPALVFRYGRRIDDAQMMGFAAFAARNQRWGEGAIPGSFGHLARQLPALFVLEELLATPPAEPLLGEFWLPDIQVMGARSTAGSSAGLYVAAKGGHNDESHNHNDVGNFIVYSDGRPVLIDVGAGEYTAKTFSSDRYTIWNMQSAYHNVPTINGVLQRDGRQFAARDVHFTADDRHASLTLDIAGAYPEEAAVQSWVRRVTLNRGRSVELHERYRLAALRRPFTLNLMTPLQPALAEPGLITLPLLEDGSPAAANTISIEYDEQRFAVTFEPIALEDARMRSGWGERLTRIVLTSKQTRLSDAFTITVRP
jgi:hypothetical protein